MMFTSHPERMHLEVDETLMFHMELVECLASVNTDALSQFRCYVLQVHSDAILHPREVPIRVRAISALVHLLKNKELCSSLVKKVKEFVLDKFPIRSQEKRGKRSWGEYCLQLESLLDVVVET